METISEVAIYLWVDINLGELIVVEMEKKKDKTELFQRKFLKEFSDRHLKEMKSPDFDPCWPLVKIYKKLYGRKRSDNLEMLILRWWWGGYKFQIEFLGLTFQKLVDN